LGKEKSPDLSHLDIMRLPTDDDVYLTLEMDTEFQNGMENSFYLDF